MGKEGGCGRGEKEGGVWRVVRSTEVSYYLIRIVVSILGI